MDDTCRDVPLWNDKEAVIAKEIFERIKLYRDNSIATIERIAALLGHEDYEALPFGVKNSLNHLIKQGDKR